MKLLPLALTLLMTHPMNPAHAAPRVLDPLLPTPGAGELTLAVKRLSVVGSVLYVAAHPDDENTRLLSWLVGERGLSANYVSLTRGDGGQNLIGEELSSLLGLIRTHELLAARRIDGANQYFTRAVDFGYSKSAEETLSLWNAREPDGVLGDLVRVVRRTRPDVMITRFSTTPPNHGHHIASAMLARLAFDGAADAARFEGRGQPHAATRLYENKSHWRFKEGEDLSRYHQLDVGAFSQVLGRSFAELAAASRTMHKSQGFGAAPAHGPQPEYFELVAARDKVAAGDPLAGLDFTWRRFAGTDKVIAALEALEEGFDPRDPARSLLALAAARTAIAELPTEGLVGFYREQKLAEVDALLLNLSGTWLDARAAKPLVVPGEGGEVKLTVWPRNAAVRLLAVRWPGGEVQQLGEALSALRTLEAKYTVPADAAWSTPYWLRKPRAGNLFDPGPHEGILPLAAPDLAVEVALEISGQRVDVVVPVRQAWVDPVHGERFRAVEVSPPVTVTPTSPTLLHPNGKAGHLVVKVVAHGARREGVVRVEAPEGWSVTGDGAFALDEDGEAEVTFKVKPTKRAMARFELSLAAEVGGQTVAAARRVVDYPHIPTTTVLSPAKVAAVVFPFIPGVSRIGYIVGPGDEVMKSLAAVGYEVTALTVAGLGREDLSRFDAIVVGVRAFNQEPALVHHHKRLMDYVARGGRYIVQYQVSSRFRPLGELPIGPAPFTVGAGRVTDERAVISARHLGIMAAPNRLGDQDFEGWVQERGLYFAERWDPAYQPLLSMADPGEAPQEGAVIAARHGKGVFIYTGLAFFRQLPEGVPGAYRLFANLLSLSVSP